MKRTGFKLVVSGLGTLVAMELALRLFSVFPIHSPSSNRRPDPLLGYTMDPERVEGIDAFGFRNESGREKVEVVAIGDSHTYGYNVSAEDAWPQQLARLSGLNINNLGMGGYGVLQYAHLLDVAWSMAPRQVVLGLYLANDLEETCALLRQSDYWQRWAEQQGCEITSVIASRPSRALPAVSPSVWTRAGRLAMRTALGSCAAYYGRLLRRGNPDTVLDVPLPGVETRLGLDRIAWHRDWMDTNRLEIAEALHILGSVLGAAQKRALKDGIVFSIALFPSKENVYFDVLGIPPERVPAVLRESVVRERLLTKAVLEEARSLGIPATDLLPAMREGVRSGTRLYPRWNEFHPVRAGYAVYARTIYEQLILPNIAPARVE